ASAGGRPALAARPGARRVARRRAASRLYRAGQEGEARRADLHPDDRDRRGLHRPRRARLRGSVLPDAVACRRGRERMNEAAVIAIAVAVGLIVAAVLLRHPLLRALGYRLVPHADEAPRDATPSAPQRENPRKEGERER